MYYKKYQESFGSNFRKFSLLLNKLSDYLRTFFGLPNSDIFFYFKKLEGYVFLFQFMVMAEDRRSALVSEPKK